MCLLDRRAEPESPPVPADSRAIPLRVRRSLPDGTWLPVRSMGGRVVGGQLVFSFHAAPLAWADASPLTAGEYEPIDLGRVASVRFLDVGMELLLRREGAGGPAVRISARGLKHRDRLVRDLMRVIPSVLEDALERQLAEEATPARRGTPLPPTGAALTMRTPAPETTTPADLDAAMSGLGSTLADADRSRPRAVRATGLGKGLFPGGDSETGDPRS